jgi:hypothetical protein
VGVTYQHSGEAVVPQVSQTRKRFREFLIAIVTLHVAAMVLYYSLGVPRLPTRQQRLFAWIWMGATVLVVFVGLARLKRARGRSGKDRDGT